MSKSEGNIQELLNNIIKIDNSADTLIRNITKYNIEQFEKDKSNVIKLVHYNSFSSDVIELYESVLKSINDFIYFIKFKKPFVFIPTHKTKYTIDEYRLSVHKYLKDTIKRFTEVITNLISDKSKQKANADEKRRQDAEQAKLDTELVARKEEYKKLDEELFQRRLNQDKKEQQTRDITKLMDESSGTITDAGQKLRSYGSENMYRARHLQIENRTQLFHPVLIKSDYMQNLDNSLIINQLFKINYYYHMQKSMKNFVLHDIIKYYHKILTEYQITDVKLKILITQIFDGLDTFNNLSADNEKFNSAGWKQWIQDFFKKLNVIISFHLINLYIDAGYLSEYRDTINNEITDNIKKINDSPEIFAVLINGFLETLNKTSTLYTYNKEFQYIHDLKNGFYYKEMIYHKVTIGYTEFDDRKHLIICAPNPNNDKPFDHTKYHMFEVGSDRQLKHIPDYSIGINGLPTYICGDQTIEGGNIDYTKYHDMKTKYQDLKNKLMNK
jgi:hypothetical protein